MVNFIAKLQDAENSKAQDYFAETSSQRTSRPRPRSQRERDAAINENERRLDEGH